MNKEINLKMTDMDEADERIICNIIDWFVMDDEQCFVHVVHVEHAYNGD